MSRNQFTFVTYSDLPNLDPDDRLVLNELAKRGFKCGAAVWTDPGFDWNNAGVCIIRSTWDYHRKYRQFLDWISLVSEQTVLINPADLLLWNSNKIYLTELQQKGIPVVPTFWLAKGEALALADVMKRENLQKAVVKPAVGLSTFGVTMVDLGAALDDPLNPACEPTRVKLEELSKDHTLMVQPYLDSVNTYGERALVFIDGRFSHAVRKMAFQPLTVAGDANEVLVEATAAEIELAGKVMDSLSCKPLFGRVDLVKDVDGEDLVIELELVEPSLYFSLYPAAVPLFADAAADCLKN